MFIYAFHKIHLHSNLNLYCYWAQYNSSTKFSVWVSVSILSVRFQNESLECSTWKVELCYWLRDFMEFLANSTTHVSRVTESSQLLPIDDMWLEAKLPIWSHPLSCVAVKRDCNLRKRRPWRLIFSRRVGELLWELSRFKCASNSWSLTVRWMELLYFNYVEGTCVNFYSRSYFLL